MVQEQESEVLFLPESDELRFLPEGPYSCGEGKFSWVAIQHGSDLTVGSLNIYDMASSRNASHPLTARPGFAFPTNRSHVFVVGLERSLTLVNVQTLESTLLCDEIDSEVEDTIINDGIVFGEGLVFGAKHLEFSDKRAGLYFWRRRDRRLFQLRDDQICSNGKIIRECDGQTYLLDIDSPTKTVVEYPFDIDQGRLGEPSIVIDLRAGDAFPDGMIATPDGQGAIIAFFNPGNTPHGEARQYHLADGALQKIWTTPGSPQVTCPQLVRFEDHVELVLTTAVEGMPPERQAIHPNAGAIFHAATNFGQVSAQPVFDAD
jgi:sugar lactone lactonase YvrE